MVTQKVHFYFSARIEWFYHGLNDFNSILMLALGLVELEASRILDKWGKLFPFLGGWLLILFRGIFEKFWLLPNL